MKKVDIQHGLKCESGHASLPFKMAWLMWWLLLCMLNCSWCKDWMKRYWIPTGIIWWTYSLRLFTACKAYQVLNLSLLPVLYSSGTSYQGRTGEQMYFIATTKTEQDNYHECCFLKAKSNSCICFFPCPFILEVEVRFRKPLAGQKVFWFFIHAAGISWHNLCSTQMGTWAVTLFPPWCHSLLHPSGLQDYKPVHYIIEVSWLWRGFVIRKHLSLLCSRENGPTNPRWDGY